jgi:hypothetical protein
MKKISYAPASNDIDSDYGAMCIQSIDDVASKILEEINGTLIRKLDAPSNSAAERDLNKITGVWIGENTREALYI